jgi:hypothetical protein
VRPKRISSGFREENLEVVGQGGELVLEAHGRGGPSIRLTEDTVSLLRVHDLREDTTTDCSKTNIYSSLL